MFKMKNYNTFEFQTANFIVRYQATDEDSEDMISEMDSDLAKSVNAELQSGKSCCFYAEIFVILKETNEVLGSSSLYGNIYENYEDFMDHYGLGYTSIINKINNPKEGEDIHKLKYALNKIKENDYTPFGSYFKDLIKEAIVEAKSTDEYKKFFETKRRKEKIKKF